MSRVNIRNRVNMVFTRKDGTYSGIDIIKYPFRIIRNELGIKTRFYEFKRKLCYNKFEKWL